MRRGFTLIEALVAIFIFAVLTSGCIAVTGSLLSGRAVITERTDALSELQRARALLRADLWSIAARNVRDGAGIQSSRPFVGESGEVLFAFVRGGRPVLTDAPRSSLQFVEYALEGRRFVRRSKPFLDGDAPLIEQTLIDGVEAARVSYYANAQWSDGWGGGLLDLPQAVRLELDIAGAGTISQTFLAQGGGA